MPFNPKLRGVLCNNFFSCHKRFAQLDPDAVRANKNAKLPSRKIMTLPELRVCLGLKFFVSFLNL